jgi:hypothetical protein
MQWELTILIRSYFYVCHLDYVLCLLIDLGLIKKKGEKELLLDTLYMPDTDRSW